MKLALGLTLALLVGSCKGAEAPSAPPGNEGEECARGDRLLRACVAPFVCREEPFALPQGQVRTMRTDDVPGGVGETCGGILSLKCVQGLVCDMQSEAAQAQGIGTCVRSSTCRK